MQESGQYQMQGQQSAPLSLLNALVDWTHRKKAETDVAIIVSNGRKPRDKEQNGDRGRGGVGDGDGLSIMIQEV